MDTKPRVLQKGDTVLDRIGRNRLVKWVGKPELDGYYRVGLKVDGVATLQFVGSTDVTLVAAVKAPAKARPAVAVPDEVAPRPSSISAFIPEAAMPHQRDGIEWLSKNPGAILADQPGLGKTLTSIGALETPALVVCPAVMKAEWADEIQKWRPGISTAIVSGVKPMPDAEYAGADVLIINYDVLAAHEEQIVKTHSVRPFKTLIADEAHNLKTLDVRFSKAGVVYSGSARAASMARLCRLVPRRYMLTATPVLNRPIELFPLLHMVDPVRWSDHVEYGKRYCAGFLEQVVAKGGRRVSTWNFEGSSNVEELHSHLLHYMLRRTKDILSLPPKRRETVEVGIPKEIAAEYIAAANAFTSWVDEVGGPRAANNKKRAEQLAKLTALRGIAARGKIPAAVKWILEHQAKSVGPLVVMAHHQVVIEGIREALALARPELRVGRIIGGQSEKQRKSDKEAFQRGDLDVILCSIMAAGVGLTLTRAAETLFVERTFRPMDLVQAEDRIHRIGQTRPCTITYMDAKGTIDEAMARILLKKTATIAGVIEGEAIDDQEAARRVFGAMFGQQQLPWMEPHLG